MTNPTQPAWAHFDAYCFRSRIYECLKTLFGEGTFTIETMSASGEHRAFIPRELTYAEQRHIERVSSRYRTFKEENEEFRKRDKIYAELELDNNIDKNDALGVTSRMPASNSNSTSGRGDKKQFYETEEDVEELSMLNSIPLLQNMPGSPLSCKVEAVPSSFAAITLQSWGHDKVIEGLFGKEIGSGETSHVFNVRGAMSEVHGKDQPVKKFAIKRLNRKTTFQEFIAEFESLKRAQALEHPHIVETLSVFRAEERGSMHFIFAFPLAVGNLKKLFRGDLDNLQDISSRKESLWLQLVGVASAVTYLHESSHTAHRDIKPSNVLIYMDEVTGDLALKLTDFGLSVDLSRALTWQEGSAAAMSALAYDAPEYRTAFLKRHNRKVDRLPSPKQILSNDIWKLGCVFTELSVFIVGGSEGVRRFRESILTETRIDTAKFISDSFNDDRTDALHFDDGEKVKPEVLNAIEELSSISVEVARIKPILFAMLADAAVRPSGRDICEYLIEQTEWAGRCYNDGTRLVELCPGKTSLRVSLFDKLRIFIESRTENPVDWFPLPPLIQPCHEGETCVSWMYGGRRLKVILSAEETQRYKKYCLPALAKGKPILPISHNTGAGQPIVAPSSYQVPQMSRSSGPGSAGASATNRAGSASAGMGTTVPLPTSAQSSSKEIYWCIDKFFSEPKETMRRPILLKAAPTDDEFYKETNLSINQTLDGPINGWLRCISWVLGRLSWKCCVAVDFKEFYIIKTGQDRVELGEKALPPSGSPAAEYEHNITPPDDIQMKLVAAQIVSGIRHPESVRGQTEMISMLPKKKVPPDFKKTMRTLGWGMHAKMGYSAKKILWWLVFCFLILVISAAPWLIWVDRFDLQNAFIPGGTVVAIFSACVGIAQVVG